MPAITVYDTADKELMAQVVRQPRYSDIARIPEVTWPTIGILLGGYTMWIDSSVLYLQGRLPYQLAFLIGGFGIFWCFTPLHDAVHRSASRNRVLNDVIGFLGVLPLVLGITTRIYRYLHLEHHKHTGDKRADPHDRRDDQGALRQEPARNGHPRRDRPPRPHHHRRGHAASTTTQMGWPSSWTCPPVP